MDKLGKVLFVDDEKRILRSLKRAFIKADFDTFFASSGKQALKLILDEKIDILVTDFRMPEMNGLKLLEIVKEKFPSIHRIILSGFVEEKAVLDALNSGMASTYFAKPWDDNILNERLVHLFEIRNSLRDKKLLELLGLIENFPTFPTLYTEFVNAIENDESMGNLIDVIQKDVAAASKILKVANSAFYGGRSVSSLRNAVVKIGLQAVKNIFLTLSIVNSMQWNQMQIVELEKIFEHSSLINRYLKITYEEKFGENLPAKYSSVGIVHNIGRIILLQYFTETYLEILNEQIENPELDFYDCEILLGRKGKTHCEIGAYFMNSWNFPQLLIEVALYHHRPNLASDQIKDFLKIFKFTDMFVSYIKTHNFRYELDLERFKEFGLTEYQLLSLAKKIRKDTDEGK